MQNNTIHADLCQSETIKGGEVQKVRNICRWVERPTLRDNGAGWHKAVLSINGDLYGAESFWTSDDDAGHAWQIVDLRKLDGTHYRLSFGPDGEHCDCPAAVYRGCICKHTAAVKAALAWLEERERLEWELSRATADVTDHAADADFNDPSDPDDYRRDETPF